RRSAAATASLRAARNLLHLTAVTRARPIPTSIRQANLRARAHDAPTCLLVPRHAIHDPRVRDLAAPVRVAGVGRAVRVAETLVVVRALRLVRQLADPIRARREHAALPLRAVAVVLALRVASLERTYERRRAVGVDGAALGDGGVRRALVAAAPARRSQG